MTAPTTSYKLEIEKIYICSSDSNQFIPFYDPDGKIFNRGPQYGCAKPHKSLKHRMLIYDKKKSTANHLRSQFQIELQNNFIKNKNNYNKSETTMDGFKLNLNTLFKIFNETNGQQQEKQIKLEEKPWFIQVMYIITLNSNNNGKMGSVVLKRAVKQATLDIYSLNKIYNNGTNMQTIKLTDKPHGYFNSKYNEILLTNQQYHSNNNNQRFKKQQVFSFRDVFLKFLLPIFVLIVFILFTIITLVFYRKRLFKNTNHFMQNHSFVKLKLKKTKPGEFPPLEHSNNDLELHFDQQNVENKVVEKNIYDNYENLMNLNNTEYIEENQVI